MRPGPKLSLTVIFVMAATLAGCIGGGRIQTAALRSGKLSVLPIQAGANYFWPNEIRVDKPGPLRVQINNVSGRVQNFTLKDPAWNTMESVDIAPGQTATVEVEFHSPGVYQFFCNKAFLSLLGMNGQIYIGE